MGNWGYGPDESDSFLNLYAETLKPIKKIINRKKKHTYPIEVIEAAYLLNAIAANPILYYKPEKELLQKAKEKLTTMLEENAFEIVHRRIKIVVNSKKLLKKEQEKQWERERQSCKDATKKIIKTAKRVILQIDRTLKKKERYTTAGLRLKKGGKRHGESKAARFEGR